MIIKPATVEPFINLLQMEEKARDMYEEYEARVKDEELRALFNFIKQQEEGHIRFARELLRIVS
jgi:rubrerythrin